MNKIYSNTLAVLASLPQSSFGMQAKADSISEDGTYDATVTTDSGSYPVPVEVEGGDVTHVHWPNGDNMSVEGAEIDYSEAYGFNSAGEAVRIEINDLKYEK
jgi:hypothetical protein